MKQLERMSITPASAAVARIPFAKDVRRLSSLSKIGHTIPPTEAPYEAFLLYMGTSSKSRSNLRRQQFQ